jgi:hypothetical protein
MKIVIKYIIYFLVSLSIVCLVYIKFINDIYITDIQSNLFLFYFFFVIFKLMN